MATLAPGTYRVGSGGSTSGSYRTYASAMGDLVSGTLSGAVTLEFDNEEHANANPLVIGVVTTATNKLTFRAYAGAKHTGKPQTGARIFRSGITSGSYIWRLDTEYVDIEDLEFCAEDSSISSGCFFFTRTGTPTAAHYNFRRCLFYGDKNACPSSTSGTYMGALWPYNLTTGIASFLIENCAFYGVRYIVYGTSSDHTIYKVIHCTAVRISDNAVKDNHGIAYAVVKNCVLFHYGGSGSYVCYYGLDGSSTAYAASDATGSQSYLDSLVIANEFTDPTNFPWDLRPLFEGNLRDYGVGYNSDATLPTTDIVGNDRDPNAPTLGAFEYYEVYKKLKLLAHPSAAGATNVAGAVFASPDTGNIAGGNLGEFTGQTFEAALEAGQAVLKVLVNDWGGTPSEYNVGDTVYVIVRNATNTTSIIPCTIIEE